MSFNFKVGGAWQSLASGWVKIGGTWQEVQSAWIKVAGAWQKVYTAFSATVDDSTPSGSDSGASPTGSVTSNVVTVTPSGGTAPYTYAWAQGPGPADATDGPFSATSPTGQSTAFQATVTAPNASEQWTCTVTDDNSDTTTVTVTVTLTWTDIT